MNIFKLHFFNFLIDLFPIVERDIGNISSCIFKFTIFFTAYTIKFKLFELIFIHLFVIKLFLKLRLTLFRNQIYFNFFVIFWNRNCTFYLISYQLVQFRIWLFSNLSFLLIFNFCTENTFWNVCGCMSFHDFLTLWNL